MFKLGLTGGIGSGKTRVAHFLEGWGACVIDTDVIAHNLTAPFGAAIAPIEQAFGPEVINAAGALDRVHMRELVFADDSRRAQLESILHPLITATVMDQAEQAKGLYTVFVVPLLVESGRWKERIDRLCVVDCEVSTQIERVQARSDMPRETIGRILQAQATREQRLAAADDVIVNDRATTIALLENQVLVLHKAWCNLA